MFHTLSVGFEELPLPNLFFIDKVLNRNIFDVNDQAFPVSPVFTAFAPFFKSSVYRDA